MTNVLILKAGETSGPLKAQHGDYDAWFMRALSRPDRRFEVVAAYQGEQLPRARDYDAIIMTGSPKSVTRLEPWMEPAGAYLIEAAEDGVPVLGVCFGHQLVAHLLGARVEQSPAGRELGTITCTLTPEGRADPLFADVEDTFEVQATHEDAVVGDSERLVVLASNAHTRNQAFRAGTRLWCVQFHPEADDATMRTLVECRGGQAEVRATPAGPRILSNFLDHVG